MSTPHLYFLVILLRIMKKLLKNLVGQEVSVLLAGSGLWYELILVTVDEEDQTVYFTDITEDEEEEESTFWELIVRYEVVLAVCRKTGTVNHDIEDYLALIKGEESYGTHEGD